MKLAILGASGSIGRQTLSVAEAHPDRFSVCAVSVGRNEEALAAIAARHKPAYAGISEANAKPALPAGTTLLAGSDANAALAALDEVDAVVIAIPGMEAIHALLAAARAKKRIAIANKECLVCGGDFVRREMARFGAKLYPIDSEQSAIFQCLQGIADPEEVSRLILTASGGPFRTWPKDAIADATPEQALAHPSWRMGKKITVDSASLVNKGLEVIEAHFLFGVPAERIAVAIHPQSIVHSMVETVDGATLAQLGTPDMRLAIQYALTCPQRIESPAAPLDWGKLAQLTFEMPDGDRFPGLPLAYEALRMGGTAPVVYNAADEVAVAAFLDGAIRFGEIAAWIASALEHTPVTPLDGLEAILETDRVVRRFVSERIARASRA